MRNKPKKRSNRLSYEEMVNVNANLVYYITVMNLKEGHQHKCIGHVLGGAVMKIAKASAGFQKPEGYKVKLTPAEIQAIYYCRNDLRCKLTIETCNGMVRLLQQQTS